MRIVGAAAAVLLGLIGLGWTAGVAVAATPAVTNTISVGTHPYGVAFSPTGSIAYVANAGSGTVSAIDTASGTVTNTISVGTNPHGVAFSPTGSAAYVANTGSDTVSVIDTASGTVTNTISVGSYPYAPATSPDGSTVYVTNYGSGTVSVIDTASDTVTNTISVGTNPEGVAFSPTGSIAYVANAGSGTVSVIDTASDTVTNTITGFSNPLGVAFSPTGSAAYITNNATSGTVSVIDTASNTVTNTISVGSSPQEIAFSPDGSTVYTPSWSSGTVSVIATDLSSTPSNANQSGIENLQLNAGNLSVSVQGSGSLKGNIGSSISGTLPAASWENTTGSGSGWHGTLAASDFSYTGQWMPQGSAPTLESTNGGTYTGTADGVYVTVTVGSGGSTTLTPYTWTDNQGNAGSGTANNGSPAMVEQGVTINFASGTSYPSGSKYLMMVGTQSTSALILDTAATGASITAATGVTSPAPVFQNDNTTVSGGSVATVGSAVQFLSAASDNGMGSYEVDPGVAVSVDANSWAATYTATVQYTIVTGP